MKNQVPKRRLIENEKIIRDQNVGASKGIKRYLRDGRGVSDTPVAFICECSNLDCDEKVNLSIAAYEKVHKAPHMFVVHPGHVTTKVERVVSSNTEYEIVEKLALKPAVSLAVQRSRSATLRRSA